MNLNAIETVIRLLGGVLAYTTLGILLYGIWRGTRRQAGLTTGRMGTWLHSPLFYFITSVIYFGACYLGWKPLPLAVTPLARLWMLALGSVLYFPGMSFALWGRLALGRHYFVSTGFGAQLFTDQPLITGGPYAIVRHPMYSGIMLAALGSLLIYATWTTLLFVLFSPLLTFRARREEIALAAGFGEQWREYCRRVPAFLPRFRRNRL
jgi:protein-S-isoprenylcysteine O-methyltransferase Ste14